MPTSTLKFYTCRDKKIIKMLQLPGLCPRNYAELTSARLCGIRCRGFFLLISRNAPRFTADVEHLAAWIRVALVRRRAVLAVEVLGRLRRQRKRPIVTQHFRRDVV